MDVSVIFATYNREDVLEQVFEAWRKVNEVTKYEYEIICSDDSSVDRTVEIIEQVKDLPIKLLRNEKGGAAKARNAALKIATGKIVIFTGDDMFPEPSFVNRHYENYLKYGENIATLGRIEWHPDIQMNYLMHHITNVGCEQFGFVGLPPYQLIDYRHFYTSNISVPMSQLKALEFFFNTDFDKYGFEDIEFGYRLEKNGMRIYYDPDIVITHHHVYNSVEKFCVRHTTAGEELVVFHGMHPELEDKCIYDIEDMRRVFEKFKEENSMGASLQGMAILGSLKLARIMTKVLEKVIVWNKPSLLSRLESILYAGIFKFYFLFGCVMRLAQGSGMHRSRMAQFAYAHMKKNYSQIYWDTGYGMNESESRRWICWDDSEVVLEKELPQNVKTVRISPLKNKCIMELKELIIETSNGEKIVPPMTWHNAQKTNWVNFDFRNTIDPQIIIENVPEGSKKITVRMSVKSMEKKNFFRALRVAAYKIRERVKTVKTSHEKWDIAYASGQARRIQICIDGLNCGKRSELIEQYRKATEVLGDSLVVSDVEKPERGYVTYHYKPEKEPLEGTQILQVAYTLLNSVYDYVLISKSFAEFPLIGCKAIGDVLIYSELMSGERKDWMQNANGRYMRLPAFEVETDTVSLYDVCGNISLQQEYFLTNDKDFVPEFRQSRRSFAFKKTKPVVFVDPIFLAVGGVERNTIEVMRALKDDYTFCMLTMERHSESQGTLHFQLKGICDYIFDLREITEFDNYLGCLYELKQIFEPDVLWMCNNSPWFERYTSQIREVFHDVAMVAQDVYDTKVGWIEYYKNPEMKLYDRYIAVTQLIKDTFMQKYQITEEKIDVIYSVIDGERIKRELNKPQGRDLLCEKYGLDKSKRYFAFVGRLTEQKNPLRLLRLIEEVKKHNRDDLHFVMVGDGVLRSDVDTYITEHELQENVTRIAYVENTPEFISMLDGLVLTSVYEGMPIVSIEAMCMSTPIFSTDTGDLKRFLDKNQNGLIVDEENSDFDNFMDFLNKLPQYKVNAKAHAKEMLDFFSADHVAEAYRVTFQKGMEQYKGKE